MRTYDDYKLCKESYDSQKKAGRYNPASVLLTNWKGSKRRFVLGCGDSDDIFVFIGNSHPQLAVVTINEKYGYCGLEIFDLAEDCKTADLFLDSPESIADALGRNGLDLSPMTIAKRLASYIDA